jgi:hypothetical protein
MTAGVKKILAREWLILTLALLVGLLYLVPLSLVLPAFGLKPTVDTGAAYSLLFQGLFSGDFRAWVLVLLPYAACQFLRSLIWATKHTESGAHRA